MLLRLSDLYFAHVRTFLRSYFRKVYWCHSRKPLHSYFRTCTFVQFYCLKITMFFDDARHPHVAAGKVITHKSRSEQFLWNRIWDGHNPVNNNFKGQKKSKWFFQVDISSKKRANKFYFTIGQLISKQNCWAITSPKKRT